MLLEIHSLGDAASPLCQFIKSSMVVAHGCVNGPPWLRETASTDPVAKMLGFGSAPGTAVRGLGRGNSHGGSPQPLESGMVGQRMDNASTDPAALHQG